jgi:adenosylcobinamide-GDP ribazoletransferase
MRQKSMSGAEWTKARLAETVAAFALLTRLPVGLIPVPWTRELRHSAWAYALAGAAVGLIGGVTYWIIHGLGVPPALAAIFAIFAMILTTGALHEDGLVDAADGLAGRSPEERLAIMRDHRIGTYGAIALVLSLGVRIGALTLLSELHLVITALIAVGAASRPSAACLMAALPHARDDGLSHAVGLATRQDAMTAVAIAFVIAWLTLSFGLSLGVVIVTAITTVIVGLVARARLGGQTGDVLGAACQLAECAGLTLIVTLAG